MWRGGDRQFRSETERVVLVRVAPTTRTRASTSDHLQLAVAVPGNPGLAGCQTDRRAGDQRVWVRIVSGWVHIPDQRFLSSATVVHLQWAVACWANARDGPVAGSTRATSAAVLSAACRPAFPIRWQ